MNLRPSGYEPDELPGCSTARQRGETYTPSPWSQGLTNGRGEVASPDSLAERTTDRARRAHVALRRTRGPRPLHRAADRAAPALGLAEIGRTAAARAHRRLSAARLTALRAVLGIVEQVLALPSAAREAHGARAAIARSAPAVARGRRVARARVGDRAVEPLSTVGVVRVEGGVVRAARVDAVRGGPTARAEKDATCKQ